MFNARVNEIIRYSKRYSERIGSSSLNIEQLENDCNFSDIFSLFFDSRNFNFFNGDSLYLEGTRPLTAFDFVYTAINKKKFVNEPWLIVMDQCSDFFELYDAKIQNRFNFVAPGRTIKAEDYIIPLFIIFFSIRNIYSKATPSLFIRDGQIVFRFEYDPSKIFLDSKFYKTKIYDFLINILKLEDNDVVDSIIENELKIEKQGTFILIRKRLFEVKHFSKRDKIINFIKAKKVVTALEIAEYFDMSKRMAEYYMLDLINDGIVIRDGKTNASNTKYRLNTESYYF